MSSSTNIGLQPLTDRPVPPLITDQVALFSKESIHSVSVMPFDVATAHSKLKAHEGLLVLGGDFGGDKGIIRLFKVVEGKLVIQTDYSDDIQGNDGEGYLDTLVRAAAYAEGNQIPFGISWGGPLDGTKPLFHPKAKEFLRELREQYSGDFAAISSSITSCLNDGPAGAISGAVEAYQQFKAKNTLFIINGGGLGSSAITDGQLYSEEAGHVPASAALNTYHQQTECGVYNATYTCIERIGANKAGIETQWEANTNSYLRARDIEDRYKAGDTFAGDLYEHSAWVVAHMVLGLAHAYSLDLASPNTAIVAHGGAFKFPHYGERIAQMLVTYIGARPQLLLAKDYVADGSNACLDGAAIAALYRL